jgi:hypothetical protein
MAVTQDVIIRVIYESDLKEGIKEVEQLGTAAKKDIDVFKSLSKEIDLGINDALKEAGVSAKQLADSVTKAGKSGEGFKSLKVQIREAREEAQLLSQKFGDTSTEAVNAQKRIATLTDELDDFNNRVKALNPEAKFKAFGQVAQGGIGALQGLTGAMQIFGSENEEVNKIIQKFQGFINVTQGIESIAGLSDTFKSLKVVLGLTTVSQEALAAATVAEGAAAQGATVANKAFAASLSATGIGAIVVGIGLLIGAWIAYNNQQDKAIAGLKLFAKNSAEADNYFLDILRNQSNAQTNQIRLLERNLKVLEGTGAAEEDILKTKIKLLDTQILFEKSLLKSLKNKEEERKQSQFIQDLEDDRLIAQSNLAAAQEKEKQESIKSTTEQIEKLSSVSINTVYLTPEQKAQLQVLEAVLTNNAQRIGELAAEAGKIPDTLQGRTTNFKEWALLGVNDFIKAEDKKRDALIATRDVTLQGAADLSNQLNALSQQDADIRIANLDRQLQAGLISEKEYATQVTQIKRKQAEQDKKIALFNAAIGIAQAIINALNFKPANAVPAAVAFASVLGAAQLATIASRPIPQFNKGTLAVPGTYQGKDSVLANLTPGEAVIPQPMRNAYLPTLQAMFDGSIKPSELNAMVTQKRTGKSAKSDNGLAELGHIFKSNKTTSIRNADELANKIADAIARKANIRWNL